jgi:hypothetical protein
MLENKFEYAQDGVISNNFSYLCNKTPSVPAIKLDEIRSAAAALMIIDKYNLQSFH